MALTGPIKSNEARGSTRVFPVAADTVIYGGSAVALNAAGFAVEPSGVTGLTAVGVADQTADNSGGANGAISVTLHPGVYGRKNSAGADAIGPADVGTVVFFVDGGTVAKVGTARSAAGHVAFIEDGLIYVQIGEWQIPYGW